MIDSVLLQLIEGQYSISPVNKLDSSRAKEGRYYAVSSSFCKEYAKKLKKEGRYFPMIETTNRRSGSDIIGEVLEIQVSIPKTIYGHSLIGVSRADLNIFCDKLVSLLVEIGIITTSKDIKQAVLKRIDFCTIIKLPDYLGTADRVICTIRDFNYKQQSDFNFNQNKIFDKKKLKKDMQ